MDSFSNQQQLITKIPDFFLKNHLYEDSEYYDQSCNPFSDTNIQDQDYMESAPFQSWNQNSSPPGLEAFYPPARPESWKCDPAWHYDRAPSIAPSSSYSDDSEEEALCPKSKTRRSKRKNNPNKSTATKLENINKTLNVIPSSSSVNFPGLLNRTRNNQPAVIFQRIPNQIHTSHKVYTLEEVIHGLKIVDSDGTMLVHLFPLDTLPDKLFQHLIKSWNKLNSSVTYPPDDYTNSRGNYDAKVYGCWYKSGRFVQPYMTAHYRGPKSGHHYKREDNKHHNAVKRFGKSNTHFWAFIEQLIKTNYPMIYEIYKNIQVPDGCHKFAGLFAAVVVNKYVQTNIHKDLGDIKGGICVIICWGKFEGGELVFSELLSVVPFPAGSIIVFRSAILSHYNLPVTGDRFSMVLMTDKCLKRWSDQQACI